MSTASFQGLLAGFGFVYDCPEKRDSRGLAGMRHRFLDFIWCPECHADFALAAQTVEGDNIVTGSLTCTKCKRSYPIIKSIPRFLENISNEADLRNVYAQSFGYQWTTYDWLRKEDEFEFTSITDLSLDALAGMTVLDAGCGGGRVSRVIAPHCKELVIFDYSIACERAFELIGDMPNVHIAHCDVNRHVFKPRLYDFVFSHGVIHHTPDANAAFNKIAPLVKQGGLLYVAVFDRAILPLRIIDSFWRSLLNKLPMPVLDKVCSALSWLHLLPFASFWKRFFWFSMQKTHQLRKCCLVDWYGPKYHSEHTPDEVKGWFKAQGFSQAKYINAWPYCPPEEKYTEARFLRRMRLGLLLGVMGVKDRDTAMEDGKS